MQSGTTLLAALYAAQSPLTEHWMHPPSWLHSPVPKLSCQLADLMEGFAAIGSHGAPEQERRATHGHVRDGAMHGAESALGVCVVVWYDRWKVPKVQ